MSLKVFQNVIEMVGNTPLIRIHSLSKISGSEIYAKAEHYNPGGSIKDRAAVQMIKDALAEGRLKPGMTIVEGTAGNTGIGLALAARVLGHRMLVVMPKGQTLEKQKMVELYGAELKLMDPCPFANPNHFYHTARRIAEESPEKYWWANQFENLSNFKAHYDGTGPEIFAQMNGKIDYLVSVAGTGGTIGGNSVYLKEKIPGVRVILVDPRGSGLSSYFHTGQFKMEGESLTEGIGIMRLVANFAKAKVDGAFTLPDEDVVTIADHVRREDGIVVGSSSALNLAGALRVALAAGPGKRIVTFLCDLGERSHSKLYNPEFLAARKVAARAGGVAELVENYRKVSNPFGQKGS